MLGWFTPFRWKLIGGLVGAGVLLWAGLLIRSNLIEQGKAQVREQAAKETKATFEEMQKITDARLSAAEGREQQAIAREQEAVRRWEAAAERVAQANQNLSRIAAQQIEARAQAERVPDAELVGSIRQKLALTPNDSSGTLNVAELREVNRVLADAPLVEKENDELRAKMAAIESKTDSLAQQVKDVQDQLAAVRDQRDAAFAWADTLHTSYVTTYNAAMRPKRKWYCAWLCTKKDSIAAPTPDTFLQNRPGKTK